MQLKGKWDGNEKDENAKKNKKKTTENIIKKTERKERKKKRFSEKNTKHVEFTTKMNGLTIKSVSHSFGISVTIYKFCLAQGLSNKAASVLS